MTFFRASQIRVSARVVCAVCALGSVSSAWAQQYQSQPEPGQGAVPAHHNQPAPNHQAMPSTGSPSLFQPYAHIGFTDVDDGRRPFRFGFFGSSGGVALKLGADIAQGMLAPSVPELGLTTYYAYSRAEDDSRWLGCWADRKRQTQTLAVGPTGTFKLPIPDVPLAIQGRVVLAYNRFSDAAVCDRLKESGNDVDVGFGVGVQYKLNQRFTLRADYDDVGWKASQLTVGAYFHF